MSYVQVHRARRMEATSTTTTVGDLVTVLLDRIEDDTNHRPLGTYVEVERKEVFGAVVLTARWNPPAQVGRHGRWDTDEEKWT